MARKQLGAAPSASTDTATKGYVDAEISAIELTPGASGASGVPGATGPVGATGPTGASGASGGTGGTGAQGASGVPGSNANVTSESVTSALGYTPESVANKAAANGYASLDANGRIPVTQLPNSVMEYQGTWNPSTNSPSLADGTGSAGDVYRVSAAGSRNLGSGSITFDVGDYVIYNGSVWQKADTTDAVSTVAGRTGDVVLTSADLGASGSASSSTFLRGDNTWATPSGIARSVSTVTTNTTVGSTAGTDYVVFSNIPISVASDASFSSTVALLLGDGANNSTTITDSSNIATNWTAYGNAKISTSTKKYGTGSIAFDGDGDYIQSGGGSNFSFGTGDFTIEFWVRLNSTGNQSFVDFRGTGQDGAYPGIFYESSALGYYVNSAYRITGSSLNTGQWYHIAVCRSGTTTKMFIDGTQTGSSYTDNANYTVGTDRPRVGLLGGTPAFPLNGNIDELRITKGVARYTSNFTAPSQFAGEEPTVTLPSAVSSTNQITVKNIHGTASLIVATTSSQTIDGSSTATLATGAVSRFTSDGSNWRTV